MAQIKKLQGGGNNPKPQQKIYGKYKYGVQEFDVNDDFLNALQQHSVNNDGGQAVSDILNYYKNSSGDAMVSYDPSTGELKMPESASTLNQQQIGRIDESNPNRTFGQKVGAVLGQVFGGNTNRYQQSIGALKTFDPNALSTKPITPVETYDFTKGLDVVRNEKGE